MGFNSIRINIFPERSLGSTRISANSYLWTPGKQNGTFKKINCRSLISKIFILFFLSLTFAFLQDIWNYQNKTNSEIQYRYSNSRKLAEKHSEENNISLNTENQEELLNFNDFTPMLLSHIEELKLKLNDLLKEFQDDLLDKARTHEISSEQSYEIWHNFMREFNRASQEATDHVFINARSIFADGPCSRDICNGFLRESETIWESFLEAIKGLWSISLQLSMKRIANSKNNEV